MSYILRPPTSRVCMLVISTMEFLPRVRCYGSCSCCGDWMPPLTNPSHCFLVPSVFFANHHSPEFPDWRTDDDPGRADKIPRVSLEWSYWEPAQHDPWRIRSISIDTGRNKLRGNVCRPRKDYHFGVSNTILLCTPIDNRG